MEWILCIELPYNTKVGKKMNFFHGQALVINANTIIGENCTIRHSTTIGNIDNTNSKKCPKIGDYVDIGAQVCILGDIIIGNNVKIGAGSVVIKDIPANSVAVGNPARVIKTISPIINFLSEEVLSS